MTNYPSIKYIRNQKENKSESFNERQNSKKWVRKPSLPQSTTFPSALVRRHEAKRTASRNICWKQSWQATNRLNHDKQLDAETSLLKTRATHNITWKRRGHEQTQEVIANSQAFEKVPTDAEESPHFNSNLGTKQDDEAVETPPSDSLKSRKENQSKSGWHGKEGVTSCDQHDRDNNLMRIGKNKVVQSRSVMKVLSGLKHGQQSVLQNEEAPLHKANEGNETKNVDTNLTTTQIKQQVNVKWPTMAQRTKRTRNAKRIRLAQTEDPVQSLILNDGKDPIKGKSSLTQFAYCKPTAISSQFNQKRKVRAMSSSHSLVRVHTTDDMRICPKFARGVPCTNEACLLRHDLPSEATQPTCYYFLQGMCLNENCPFRHVKGSDQPCPRWSKTGYCTVEECPYKHIQHRNRSFPLKRKDSQKVESQDDMLVFYDD